MTTGTQVNSVIDAILARLTANIALLGGTASTPVIEGDEEPAAVKIFPSLFVVPLVGTGDHMTQHMNSSDLFHVFPVTIIGFYKDYTVTAKLRTVRDYGYIVSDLFSGPVNYKIAGSTGAAVVVDWTVKSMYWRFVDRIVHNFVVELQLKSVTKGGA